MTFIKCMTPPWQPVRLARGGRVRAKFKPAWGIGEVLDVLDLGTFDIGSGPEAVNIRYRSKSTGQRVRVRFEDGRTRTLLTPIETLEVQP